MNRCLIAAFAILISQTFLAAAEDRPNVVLVVIDDLGRNDLGCYGSTYHRTPNLDRLAREGMKFTDAYAACPVCSPTRAAVLTGKYPARLHLTDWLPGRGDRSDQRLLRPVIAQQLPLAEITLAEVLKSAGYATGHVGKWHLGGEGFEPEKQGFDVNVAGDHTGTPLSYFAPYRNRQGRVMPGLGEAPDGEYLTDRLTAEAEKFIEAHRTRPFFLYLAHYTVHIPLRAKADTIARYKPGGKAGTQNNPIYAAMVESMDESVGRIMRKLDQLKLSDRTIIIFTSDNGGLCVTEGPNTPATTNAPLREGKGYLYEGGIRAPLLVRAPGATQPGAVNDTPVSSIDIVPTVLDLCRVPSPVKTDGTSLAPLLRGGKLDRDAIYWHYPHYSNQGGKPGSAVRSGDFKLIEFFENGRQELFNVRQDSGEIRNLIQEKPDVARTLAARLEAWRQAVAAQPMRPNPNFVPNPQAADGTITLPARTADVHGLQLRYEPMPHKNTLGFWTRAEDWASWDFEVSRPGAFQVQVLQGCGKGQGGSQVEFALGDQKLTMEVEDTGGFQAFKQRDIGQVRLDKPGRHTLTVKPKSKAAAAVMDLRSVVLKPVTP